MRKLKLGIVGCGAIGSSLGKIIIKDFSDQITLSSLFDINISKAQQLSHLLRGDFSLAVNSFRELIRKSQFIIEAASSNSSRHIARRALEAGCNIMVMSVGGIIGHVDKLVKLARSHQVCLYIPSGAISGLDGLKAARLINLREVTLTTIKNPLAFRGVKYLEEKGINLEGLRNDKILYFGPAKEAVRLFPQNINVAAVLSLAGVGADRTQVKIVASPRAKKNIHEVRIDSTAGTIFTRTENILHPENPKTSYLAVLSAVATLKQILSPIKIGT